MKALLLTSYKKELTQVYDKHLINIYNRPMIAYAIETIKQSGITDIILSLPKDRPGLFIEYLQDGTDFGVHLTYIVQDDSKGIPNTINQAESLLGNKFIVYLADNYFSKGLNYEVKCFESLAVDAMTIIKTNTNISNANPSNQTVALTTNTNNLIRAIETSNPNIFTTEYEILLGAYFFTDKFFEIYKKLTANKRNNYKISDILNMLVPNVLCMPYMSEWYKLETYDDILKCSNYIFNKHI